MDRPNNEPAGWSRRGFLTPRGLGSSLGGLLREFIPETDLFATDDRQTFGHLCISRRAMACEFSVYLPPQCVNAIDAGHAALAEIDEMEDLLTVYRESSAMSYVNRHAATAPVRTDARLFGLLQRSAELTRQTWGGFDITSGALIKAWGFFRGPKRVPSEAERLAALARTGMGHVILNEEDRSVRYAVEGLEINLGSIGKGYAIDRAVARMRDEHGVSCCLMQGGSSSLMALGSPGRDGRGWLVAVENPWDATRHVATVRLKDRALGTSSTSNQYFEHAGRRYGHLIDPRTGFPADEVGAASVVAPDAATADALATAFFILGLDKTADFCHHHPEIGALLVLKPTEGCGSFDTPRVVTFNLRPDEVNLMTGDGSPAAPAPQSRRSVI